MREFLAYKTNQHIYILHKTELPENSLWRNGISNTCGTIKHKNEIVFENDEITIWRWHCENEYVVLLGMQEKSSYGYFIFGEKTLKELTS